MNLIFRNGFEKTAKIGKSLIQKVWSSGDNWAASIAKKRAARDVRRSAQRSAIRKSYGGTDAQAGAIRTNLSNKRPLVKRPVNTDKATAYRSKELNLRLTPRSTWKKALNS